jgi:beta-galactosidase
MNILSKLQAVAHGSDTVQYFQWRKSLGSFEKFHGAVVDHSDRDDTRVFREAADLGSRLESLAQVAGSDTHASVAILFDWENRWALEDAMGPRNDGRREYVERCKQHYLPFWQRGIAVDVIDSEDPLESYQLVVAPMLYMLKPGAERNIRRFVEAGGTFVTTYWSCIVDQHDLCFFGGFPGPLRDVLGIWNEEIDSLYPEERNALVPDADCDLTLRAEYELRELCERIHSETAQPLAHYKTDFYAGEPALTRNRYGGGQAYYLAARAGEDFLDDFYGELAYRLGLPRAVDAELPRGVTVRERRSGDNTYLFFQNFTTDTHRIELNEQYRDLVTGAAVRNELRLDAYGVRVLTPAAH